MIRRQLGLETADAEDRNPPTASYMQAIERGLESGLIDELEDVVLDAHQYELNSALVVALETPDAAQRWLNGENPFADCPVCHPASADQFA